MEHIVLKSKEKLEKELSQLLDKHELTISEIELMTDIVCALEKADKILDKEDRGYSGRMHYDDWYPVSYERGRSMRTGRYVSRGHHDMDMGYSGHSIKDRMIDRLEEMYDEAGTDHERKLIDKWIQRIEHDN